jgi:predicted phosphodiesterase
MRFQLFSDLHADVAPHKSIKLADRLDAVVVAGDVCEGAQKAFRMLRGIVPVEIPIVAVLGNHEFYGRFHSIEVEEARRFALDFGVSLLEEDSASIRGVRFVGATAWTDYRLFGDRNAPAAMTAARTGLNDHRRIGWRKTPWGRFRPEEALMLHWRTRAFLKDALATDQPTVVVTHHAPSMLSVADRYKTDILTAAFASSIAHDLLETPLPTADAATEFLPRLRADVWCHGHTHNSADYVVGTTRVIANPHGYGNENEHFDPSLVVEIEA